VAQLNPTGPATRRYRTVLPLHNLDVPEKYPFQLAPDIFIDSVPQSLLNDKLLERQGAYDLNQLRRCSSALIIEYQAPALYSSDPDWTGEQPRTIEARNIEIAFLVNFSLWVQHPSPAGFTLAFHMPEFDDFIIQASAHHDQFLCHPDDQGERIDASDLVRARKIFTALRLIKRHSAVWTSLRATSIALQLNQEEVRYLLLWVALEALFGATSELKFRISQRIAFFIARDRVEANRVFVDAKKAYDLRSRIAHGSPWKPDNTSTALVRTTETILRRSITEILEERTVDIFTGSNEKRAAFLDNLVFAKQPYSAPSSGI
jgi:hypothetical protein